MSPQKASAVSAGPAQISTSLHPLACSVHISFLPVFHGVQPSLYIFTPSLIAQLCWTSIENIIPKSIP